MSIHFDSNAIREVLRSVEMRTMVKKAAEELAAKVEHQGIQVGAFRGGSGTIPLPVEVREETSDRAKASVVLAHPAGVAVQAKHGVLTRAASEMGLRVRG